MIRPGRSPRRLTSQAGHPSLPDTFHAERGLSLPMGLDNSSYLRIRPHRMNARQSHRQHSDAEECAKDGICFQPSVEFALTFRRQRLIFPPGAHASLPFARSREFQCTGPMYRTDVICHRSCIICIELTMQSRGDRASLPSANRQAVGKGLLSAFTLRTSWPTLGALTAYWRRDDLKMTWSRFFSHSRNSWNKISFAIGDNRTRSVAVSCEFLVLIGRSAERAA
jgi:hypothetical protein